MIKLGMNVQSIASGRFCSVSPPQLYIELNFGSCACSVCANVIWPATTIICVIKLQAADSAPPTVWTEGNAGV